MFNLKKYSQNKQDQTGGDANTPQTSAPTSGSSPNKKKSTNDENEILSNEQENKKKEEDEFQQAFNELAAPMNKAIDNLNAAQELLKGANAAFGEISNSSLFKNVVPDGPEKACTISTNMLNEVVSPDEIDSIQQDILSASEDTVRLFSIYMAKVDYVKNNIDSIADSRNKKLKATEQLNHIENQIRQKQVEQKNNQLSLELNKRKFGRFNLLYQDMFNYYTAMTRMCTVEKRYNAQKKALKMGSPEDRRALINLCSYCMSLLKIMAPKAATINPKNAGNIKESYEALLTDYQNKIYDLNEDPIKALYGGS